MRNEVLEADLYRYYGSNKKRSLGSIFIPLDLSYIIAFRKYQSARNKIYRFFCRIRLELLQRKTHISIPVHTKIGKGFYIGHVGGLIINADAVIGVNCNIAPGVVIGQTNRGNKKGVPTIGNKVWIGANAVIVGKITIGNDVLIAPNSYVNFDVPDHSVVSGNPASIFHRDNATDCYIRNTVE